MGCALDIDNKEMRFFLNGRDMVRSSGSSGTPAGLIHVSWQGVAFSGFDVGEGLTPCVTCNYDETIRVIFEDAVSPHWSSAWC